MTESQADMKGIKLSRDERKAMRIEELRQADYDRLIEIRDRAKKAIVHLESSHQRQLTNGLPVTSETLAKNCSCHKLTVECVDFILDEAMVNYGDR